MHPQPPPLLRILYRLWCVGVFVGERSSQCVTACVRASACTTGESYTRISLGQGCVRVRPAEAKLLTEVHQEGGLTVSLTPGIARAHTHNTRSDLPQITAAVCKCPRVHTAGVSSVCVRGDSGGVTAGLMEATCHLRPALQGWGSSRRGFNLSVIGEDAKRMWRITGKLKCS